MKLIKLGNLTPEQYASLLRRPGQVPMADEGIKRICLDVKNRRDEAVRDYTARFDAVVVNDLRVSEEELATAEKRLPGSLRAAMLESARSLHAFHKNQGKIEDGLETVEGVRCWRERRPMNRAGLYVPAGSAPLPSTVLMLGIPAILAGCPDIVLCSPPGADGSPDPLVLAAARLVGIHQVYRIGGAQAIAAMAYGTESVPRVDKIFGPGNAIVTAAKRFVSTDPDGAAIDMLAGPSELLIIADDTASPSIVAADLLSQAEHGPDSPVVLVTPDAALLDGVCDQINTQIDALPRKDTLLRSLESSLLIEVDSLEEAVRFSNDYAPEHLIINTRNPQSLVSSVTCAGSVFLGQHAPVTAGDYASGTNHTLPTGGTARHTSGLSVESFQKTITFQSITPIGLAQLRPTLVAFADAEGLEAHKRAVLARFG